LALALKMLASNPSMVFNHAINWLVNWTIDKSPYKFIKWSWQMQLEQLIRKSRSKYKLDTQIKISYKNTLVQSSKKTKESSLITVFIWFPVVSSPVDSSQKLLYNAVIVFSILFSIIFDKCLIIRKMSML